MPIDPHTPVVVGVAQAKQQPDNLGEAVEALALMEQVIRSAASDAGSDTLVSKLDHIGVIKGAWPYSDPGRLLAQNLGATSATSGLSWDGGNTPQAYVAALGQRIAAGQLDWGVVVGAETIWSRRRKRRADMDVAYTDQPPTEPDERFGTELGMTHQFETSRGFEAPIQFYPIFDSAIRAQRGETLDQHRDRLAELWARFNAISTTNPYAWSPRPMTAQEIRNPSPTNRMVGFPYTKAMNSNWDLDQAAAIIVCSAQAATGAGIARDRWIFPWAGTQAQDTGAVSHRRDLHSSPAIEAAGQHLFALCGLGPEDLDLVDLYSCFPSAVQVAAAELGLDESRDLTVTGGLTFAGGPLNNYVTHSIAAMVEQLRARDSAVGLVSANGGFLTKHALGIYSTAPPAHRFTTQDVQAEVDEVPSTRLDPDYEGPVTIEAYTVMHSKQGPETGLCALQTPDGARTWGSTPDQDEMAFLLSTEGVGHGGKLSASGRLNLA